MSIQIPSNTSFRAFGPKPSEAIAKYVPRAVQDRMRDVPMPVEYEEGCRAIDACATIEEGKYWSDKSDALAAWAKIYKSDEAALAARRLKLRALGVLSRLSEERAKEEVARQLDVDVLRSAELVKDLKRELQSLPGARNKKHRRYQQIHALLKRARKGEIIGSKPGSKILPVKRVLVAAGLTDKEASDVRSIGQLGKAKLAEAIERGDTVSRASLAGRGVVRPTAAKSDSWHWLVSNHLTGPHLFACRTGFRSRDPREVAAGISKGEVKQARELAIELYNWLDAFEQALPKS